MEQELVQTLSQSNELAIHVGRTTVGPSDLRSGVITPNTIFLTKESLLDLNK